MTPASESPVGESGTPASDTDSSAPQTRPESRPDPAGPATRGLLPASWRVDLPIFEGPLDLLLHLVKVNEVEITDIPVALICDQYHEYLELMDELDLDIAGEYIYEAAVLIQLKARTLLPRPETPEGEVEEDPRQDLVERLLEYQRLKDAAQTLAEVHSLRRGLWTREPEALQDPEDEELDLGELSMFDLLKALSTVLERYDAEHPEALVYAGERFTVKSQIESLLARLDRGHAVDLVDHMMSLSCRSEAIAAFLAVLEMSKMQLVKLHVDSLGSVLLHRTEQPFNATEFQESFV